MLILWRFGGRIVAPGEDFGLTLQSDGRRPTKSRKFNADTADEN